MHARAIANEIIQRKDFQSLVRRMGRRRWLLWREPVDVEVDQVTRIVRRLQGDPGLAADWAEELASGEYSAFSREQSYNLPIAVWLQIALLIARILFSQQQRRGR